MSALALTLVSTKVPACSGTAATFRFVLSTPDRLIGSLTWLATLQVGFYERFHRDTVDFASKHAKGRVVSVLEGGYGDRALASGAMASVVGLSTLPPDLKPGQIENWWSVSNLVKVSCSQTGKLALLANC